MNNNNLDSGYESLKDVFPFTQLLESIENPVLIVSESDGRIIFVNKAAIDFYGYSREEFQSLKCKSISAMPESITNRVMKKAFSNTDHHFVTLHKQKNNKLVNIEIITSVIHIDNRKYLLVYCFDITTAFVARQKMKKSYEEVNNILQALPETVILYDKNANIKFFKMGDNPKSMFRNFNPLGMNLRDTGMPKETIKDTLQIIKNTLETGDTVYLCHYFYNPKGYLRYHYIKVVPLNFSEVLFIVNDISDEVNREKSERRYQLLFDNLFDPVLVRDVETGNVFDVNESMCRLMGYTREEFLKLHREDYLKYPDQTYNITTARTVNYIGKVYLKTRSGETVAADVRAFPAEIEGRRVAFAIFNNINEPVAS